MQEVRCDKQVWRKGQYVTCNAKLAEHMQDGLLVVKCGACKGLVTVDKRIVSVIK